MGPSTHRMNPPVLKGLQEQQWNSMNLSMVIVHLLQQVIMEQSSHLQMESRGLQGLPVQQTISMGVPTTTTGDTEVFYWLVHLEKLSIFLTTTHP